MRPNIEAIFERYEDATRGWMEYSTVLSAQDVPALLAYIDELENMPLVQTVVKLQEENERLREILNQVNKETYRVELTFDEDGNHICNREGFYHSLLCGVSNIARQALEESK